MTATRETYEGWTILEILGHRRLVGYVREQEIAGSAFLRIDIPSDPPVTQLYAPASVYCLTPTTEEIARALAQRSRPEPVHRWELPASVTVETTSQIEDDDPFDVDLDEEGPPF